MSMYENMAVAVGVDVDTLPDRLNTTFMKAICEKLGVDTSDMDDNLLTSYFEQIATEYSGGGGGINVDTLKAAVEEKAGMHFSYADIKDEGVDGFTCSIVVTDEIVRDGLYIKRVSGGGNAVGGIMFGPIGEIYNETGSVSETERLEIGEVYPVNMYEYYSYLPKTVGDYIALYDDGFVFVTKKEDKCITLENLNEILASM